MSSSGEGSSPRESARLKRARADASKRTRSDSQLSAMQSDTNKNVEWIRSKMFWASYVFLLLVVRGSCWALLPKWPGSDKWEWTILNVANGVISFLALHWARGSPIWEDQGEYIEATVWEQIDNGVPWTDTRKFLMIVPVVLFLVSAHSIVRDPLHLAGNIVLLAILIVAKIPELHGVRIFGLNRAHIE